LSGEERRGRRHTWTTQKLRQYVLKEEGKGGPRGTIGQMDKRSIQENEAREAREAREQERLAREEK
jgi:hypothetical protein